jgi:hypothetical protein
MTIREPVWLGDTILAFAFLLGVFLMLVIFSSALLP